MLMCLTTISDLGVGENDDFTIEAFFYVPDLNNDDTRVEVIARKQDSYTFYIDFDKDTPDWIFFELIAFGGGEIRLGVELDILTGWHHAAVVFDNEYTEEKDMMAIFLDGNEVANSNDEQFQPDWTPGIPNSFRQLVVGNSGLYGYMEEIRHPPLCATAVLPIPCPLTLYHGRQHPPLWHFDETPGSTVFEDASSYNNDLIGEDGAQTYNP